MNSVTEIFLTENPGTYEEFLICLFLQVKTLGYALAWNHLEVIQVTTNGKMP